MRWVSDTLPIDWSTCAAYYCGGCGGSRKIHFLLVPLSAAENLFGPAAFTILFLFFLGGPKQLVKTPKIKRVRFAQLLADLPQAGARGHLDNLNYVGAVLHAVRTQLGFHPPGESCIAPAFVNPHLLGAGNGARCVLARLATLGNDINR